MNYIGEQIKRFRKANKLTQEDLAKRIGVTKSAISAYENGTRTPSFDVLLKFSRIFKVSTDSLLGRNKKDYLDITGLSINQQNTIQNVISAYQLQNKLLLSMYGISKELDDETLDTLILQAESLK